MKVKELIGDLDIEALRARLHTIRSTRVITPKVEKRNRKVVDNRNKRAKTSIEKIFASLSREDQIKMLQEMQEE